MLAGAADQDVQLQLNLNGSAYCSLTIPANKTYSNNVDGAALPPLPTGGADHTVDSTGGVDLSRQRFNGLDSTLMAEQLTKLRPDRDLQCYFQQPSAVAALSNTSATQFTVSGTLAAAVRLGSSGMEPR